MGEKKIKVRVFKCERCGHEWTPRKEGYSVVCAGCKSPYWNKKRHE